MDLKLQGRVVAITGGASGIGRSCALRYLEEGCRVAVCGRASAPDLQASMAIIGKERVADRLERAAAAMEE